MHTLSTPQNPASTSRPSSRQSALSSTRGKATGELRRKPSAGFLTASTATPAVNPAPSPSGRARRVPPRITSTTTTTARNTISPPTTSTPGRVPGRVTTPASARPALRPRDKNVVAVTARTLNTKSHMSVTRTAPKMPPEKGSATHTRQPPMPPLSAAAARGAANKAPLTPKIATTRSATPQHRTVTVTTPLPKRSHRPESALSNGGATNSNKDDVASPVAAFLNNNVTPRSGSRQNRIDSASSTPTGTPNLEAQDSWETRTGLGLTPSAFEGDSLRRPAVTFTPPPEATSATKQDPDSKFFYASQASKHHQQQQPTPQARPSTTQPQKSSTFFYANGGVVPERQNAPPTNPTPVVGAVPAPDSHRTSKFFYANSTPSLPPVARPAFSPTPGSTVSTSSKPPTGRHGTSASSVGYASQRPPSPVKIPSFPPPRNDTNAPFSTPRSTVGTTPPLNPATATFHRPSIDTPTSSSTGHSRTRSLTVADPPAVARIISESGSRPSSEASSPSSFASPPMNATFAAPAVAGFSSLLQAADDLAEEDEDEGDTKSEVPQSPTKRSSQDQALNELVASARRERKVQDLEITNASLEAINRTLERQLRKQTSELRRYKRLSRSGRLSLTSLPARDRIASDSTAGGGALARAGLDLDDLSEEESEEEREDAEFYDEDDFSESESESEDGSTRLSPGEFALRDARHRKRDEERLRLDLSKHQQLLVDSQQMNQSLKKCLGWTEELIKEGRRALAYQVRVSEVNLGGRVLAPEDVEEREETSESGDDEALHSVELELNGSLDIAGEEPWPKEPPDRDSGIELPTDAG